MERYVICKRSIKSLCLIVTTVLFVSACGSDSDDEPLADAQTTATLSSIQSDIFTPICIQCHGGESPAASLSLEEGVSHSSLVDVQATNAPNVRVETGDSASSFLIRKLRGTDLTETEGARMPLNGPPYLDEAQIELIAQWIDAGALDN